LLSLIRVLEWRAAVTPDAVALTDHRRVATVEALARNATGKVLRAALREPFWAGRDRRVS
jgi:acyl-CoA synthetase (AMP-forming)/AMP-acid ligase II